MYSAQQQVHLLRPFSSPPQSFLLIRLLGFTLLQISPIHYVTVPSFSTVLFVTTWKQAMWFCIVDNTESFYQTATLLQV